MFKWTCLALAVVTILGLGLVIIDLRAEVKHISATVNANLGEIMVNTRETTETLAILADDIKQLRDLAGATTGTPRDRTLVAYADRLLDLIESTDAVIGLDKKVFGEGLKDTSLAKEWAIDARKEALWLTFRVTSREEFVERLCKNKFGSDWYIQESDADPIPLIEWLNNTDLAR